MYHNPFQCKIVLPAHVIISADHVVCLTGDAELSSLGWRILAETSQVAWLCCCWLGHCHFLHFPLLCHHRWLCDLVTLPVAELAWLFEGQIGFHCDLVVHWGIPCWGEKSVLVLELVAVSWVRTRLCYKKENSLLWSMQTKRTIH